MIPIGQIIPENLFSQDDAEFLLGKGFTKDAAREVIREACRSEQLKNKRWRRRYWFTGREFLEWVSRWFGAEIETEDGHGEDGDDTLAGLLSLAGC
jgi:hypothetical protein